MCDGDGFIETGTGKHRETLGTSVVNFILSRTCRAEDDYYASEEYLPEWVRGMRLVQDGIDVLFDLYKKRYGMVEAKK